MNKSELIEKVALKAGVTKKKAEDAVNLIFGSMFDAMVRGERIEIRGLGSFVVKEYGAYIGRNPRTGESIQVKPKKLPFFKVGKELKERVDKGPGPQVVVKAEIPGEEVTEKPEGVAPEGEPPGEEGGGGEPGAF